MAAAAAWLCVLAVAQDPAPVPPAPPPPAAEVLLERFGRLAAEQRAAVVRGIERRLRREDWELLQRIQSCERGEAAYPQHTAPTWYEPAEYAPGAAPRRLAARGTEVHRAATHRIRPFEFLPDLHRAVAYDWVAGTAARTGVGLDDERRFANYVHGYAPGADHAVAQVLAALDTDPVQRQLAAYFEHLYADRDGAVFQGVPLFDAWNSGVQLEMPDTDAIAYARKILHTQSFTAPLPADRRRERLYQRIREGFASHREYRSLRYAAAAAFVAADPRIEATYEPLCRRAHWLWHKCGHDHGQLAARLARTPDRTALLAEIDAAIQSEPDVIAAARQELQELATFLRSLADAELTRAGG